MRFRLSTLMIFLALGPPAIAREWWYWKESSFALLVLIVIGFYLILWVLYLILWLIERMYDALGQLISVKPRRPRLQEGPRARDRRASRHA